MTVKRGRTVVCAVFFAVFLLSQCAPAARESTGLKVTIKPAEFAGEIGRLDGIAHKHHDPATRATAHLQLAMLYSSYNNPSPDYSLALKELETYLSLKPEKGKEYEIANWLAILRELKKLQDEMNGQRQRIDQLMRSEKELKESEKKKEKENRELREIVEQLKALDVRMEEKRKQIK